MLCDQNLLRPNCGEAVGNPAVGLVVVLGDLCGTALLDVPEKVSDLKKKNSVSEI